MQEKIKNLICMLDVEEKQSYKDFVRSRRLKDLKMENYYFGYNRGIKVAKIALHKLLENGDWL